MYTAAMRAGDAPRWCEFGQGTLGLEMRMMNGEVRGCVRKKCPCSRKKSRGSKRGSGTVVLSTLRAVPATVPDPHFEPGRDVKPKNVTNKAKLVAGWPGA
jgi:hypothetical protein